jgi:uncharacterized protein (UPF0303 family)
MLRRTIRALAASVATGVAIYVMVVRMALPSIARSLSSEQVDWLRRAFATHPWLVMSSLMTIALVLALPVLVAFRLAFGPMRGKWRRPLR